MKKILILFFVVCVIFIGSYFLKNVDDSQYAVLVDGVYVKNFPSRGNYSVTVDCENSVGTWNYLNWNLEVTDITDDVVCDIEFETIAGVEKLSDLVISLSGSESGVGKIIHEVTYTDVLDNPVLSDLEYYSDVVNDEVYPFEWNDANKTWTSTNHDSNSSSSFVFKPNENSDIYLNYVVSSEDLCDGT